MTIKGVFLDFGFVIGFPTAVIDRKYFYLDWAGIETIMSDQELAQFLRPGVGRMELEAFFDREIYRVFVEHEQTDGVDPQTNDLLLHKLHLIFTCPINQLVVDKLLTHINPLKYITIDDKAVEIVLELKRRGLRVALVSNMMLPGNLLIKKLQEANILACFDQITISSEVGFIKPHPTIFLKALAQLKLKPYEVLFVGDTYLQDIKGAKQVGMKTVWYNTRHEPRGMVVNNPPDYEIKTLGELVGLPIFRM